MVKNVSGSMRIVLTALLLGMLLLSSCATNDSMETFQDYLQSSDMSFESQNAELIAKVNKLQTQIETLENEQETFVKQDTLTREAEKMGEEIDNRIGTLSGRTDTLEADLQKNRGLYAEKAAVDSLSDSISTLRTQFNSFSTSITQLVEYAGYDADAGISEIGRDIVDISKHISALNEKIERLREAMALFVNAP